MANQPTTAQTVMHGVVAFIIAQVIEFVLQLVAVGLWSGTNPDWFFTLGPNQMFGLLAASFVLMIVIASIAFWLTQILFNYKALSGALIGVLLYALLHCSIGF